MQDAQRTPLTGRAPASRWDPVGAALAWLRSEGPALVRAAGAMAAAPWLDGDTLDVPALHRTPVVLVHGLCGHASNFAPLRAALGARGITRFASFSYLPRIDFPRLAPRFRELVSRVCDHTGSAAVDVVGHSLGGLVARYALASTPDLPVRRLVTIGSPHDGGARPARELAIFGALDPLVPPPDHRRAADVRVVPGCAHVALLHHPTVLLLVARHLARPLRTSARAVGLAA